MPGPFTIPPTPPGYDLRYSPHGVSAFEYAGAQYAFLVEGAEFEVGDQGLHILKSTDDGATWTELASIDPFPVTSNPPIDAVTAYCICKDGTDIHILACDTQGTSRGGDQYAGPLLHWVFDLANDVLVSGPSTPTNAPTVSKWWNGGGFTGVGNIGLNLVRRGPGDMLLVYPSAPQTITGLTYNRIYVVSFDGAAFGTPVQLAGQSGNEVIYAQGGVAIDSAGILHVILSGNGATGTFNHVAMDSAGNFGAMQEVEADCFLNHTGPPEDASNLLVFTASTEKLAFLGLHDDLSSTGELLIYFAAAGALEPVWSSGTVPTSKPVVLNAVISSGLCTALAFSGTMYAFWTTSGESPDWDPRAGFGAIQFSSAPSALDLTVWSADAQLFASVEDTFATSQVLAWTGELFIGILANSSIGGTDPFEISEFFSVAGVAPGPPQLDCITPPIGTVGVAGYTYFFCASEGTPPYTWSVNDEGLLPPGLTFDRATGIISGTPTVAGEYPFEVTVTDNIGLTDTAPVSITIEEPTPSAAGNIRITLRGVKRTAAPRDDCRTPEPQPIKVKRVL